MKLDPATWKRQKVFEFFSSMDWPFCSVTFQVDVTEVSAFAHDRGISFYYSMVYLCTRAVMQVENLMLDIRKDGVYRLSRRIPSFTDMHPGEDQFHIVTMDMADDGSSDLKASVVQFAQAAREKSRAQQEFIDLSQEGSHLIFFSCLPWLSLTALTNERNTDPDDSVPRIAWGRWTESGGRKILGLSMEVNHRLVDGVHIARFAQALEEEIRALGLSKAG
ncbi:MAG: chloramphenicol acetyltransferase [Clostridia bacterium]|nr:chloramphenicol acetyltransferase [Clostridia bacterium]